MNPDVLARVDGICDAFEQRWREGKEPALFGVLEGVEVELQAVVAQQLMLVDAEYRRAKYGAAPSAAEYAVRMGIDSQVLLPAADTLDADVKSPDTPVRPSHHILPAAHHDNPAVTHDNKTSEAPPRQSSPKSERRPEIPGYEILDELRHGGMGVVYKARQIRAGRIVALKTIHPRHSGGSDVIARFQAEAKAAAALSHPAIVPIYEVGEHNGEHYFSMEFIDGPNLEDMARDRDQLLSSRDAARICREIADALQFAHERNIIHRDVKPSNVLIGSDGKPRLTDFGLALLIHQDRHLTATGQILGTPAYMPPEQAAGDKQEIGPSADIYALGATLYRLITGRPPFQAASSVEILRQVESDPPVRPRRLNQEIPLDLETLCLKCLEKRPQDRISSAGELSDELSRFLNGVPLHTRPLSMWTRGWRWCVQRPAIATSVVMAFLLFIALSAGAPLILLQQNRLQQADLQRQLDAEAVKEAESAKATEERFRRQAEELAASEAARAANQEYYASIMEVREQRLQPQPRAGWTWWAMELLQKAAKSSADGKDAVALRSLMADILMTPDIREIGRIEGVTDTHALAVSHDGTLLAAGDNKSNPSQVRIYRIDVTESDEHGERVEFELIKTCSVNTTLDYIRAELIEKGALSGFLKQEGMWALDFSPDDSKIAVGTRNGNITIWQIDCDPPQILFDKRYPEKQTVDLFYSEDGTKIFTNYSVPNAIRIFNIEDQTDHVMLTGDDNQFTLLSDNSLLYRVDGTICRIQPDTLEEPISFTYRGPACAIHGDRRHEVAMLGALPPVILDPYTGEQTLKLESLPSEVDWPQRMRFAADTSIAIGTRYPQEIRIWDAISGMRALDVSYPGYEVPRICTAPERDRFYVYSTVNMFAYRLRCYQPWNFSPTDSPPRFHDLMPAAALAPGAQVISSFAISDDQHNMAVIEAASVSGLASRPHAYRARLRRINTLDGKPNGTWTSLLLGEDTDRFKLSEGESVTFLDGGSTLAFTTPAMGNLAVVSDAGFHFPSGIGIDVDRWTPSTLTKNDVTWTGGDVAAISDTAGCRPAIAVQMPRKLHPSKERLVITFNIENVSHTYELSDRHLNSSGWFLVSLDEFAQAHAAGTWTVAASLVDSTLQFRQDSEAADQYDENSVKAGDLYLLPWRKFRRGNTPPIYPYRLGPLSTTDEGGLAAIIERRDMQHWNADLTAPYPEGWSDELNSRAGIRALVTSRHGSLVGTISGLVSLVAPDGSQQTIERSHTENGPYDSRDGVQSAAIAEDRNLAFVGTLKGQIKTYNLLNPGAPVFVTDAHEREVIALAVSRDGTHVASGAADGSLSLWTRHDDQLEILFTVTTHTAPIDAMEFSIDGSSLYTLRHGDRGIVRMDLAALANFFTGAGVPFP